MQEQKKCIVFSGGGTAGHVFPNLAIIEKLMPNYRIVYIGSKSGMEKDIVSKIAGITYYGVTTVKLKRKFSPSNLLIPFKLIKGILQAKKILKIEKPALVFTKGGFVSLPAAFAAKCPLFCHESDFSMGLANRLIRKKCIKFFTAFPETAAKLNNGVFAGSPVRPSIYKSKLSGSEGAIFAKIQARALSSGRKILLIMGGSLGAGAINEAAQKNIKDLSDKFETIHLTGKGKPTGIADPHYTQLEFCSDMGALYSITDVALSRGGGSALFELAALKIPALIVPLPKGISRGDQIDNASSFEKRNLCRVLNQSNLPSVNLCKRLMSLLFDAKLKEGLQNSTGIDGTAKILSVLNEYL